MTDYVADRALETSTTQGTVTYNLAGATAGYRTLVAAAADISGAASPWTVWYLAEDSTNWEVGIGTLTDGTPDTLARTTVKRSSNSNAAVNWGPGTRNIAIVAAADLLGPLSTAIWLADQTIRSVNADAGEGPSHILDRFSASPAANDLIGALVLRGRSSTAVARDYAKILAQILDPTNASEDGELAIQTIVAGTLASRMIVGQGVRVGAPTGGDPGAGGVNATALKVNNVGVALQGKQTIAMPAGSMRPRSANGCAQLAVTNGAANQPDVPYLAFDGAAKEYAGFYIPMPKSWDRGTVTARFTGRRASGTGAANVVLGIRAVAVSDDETPAVAFGSDATVTDACNTTLANLQITAETAACTVAGSPAAGDLVFFEIFRDGASGSDTLDAVDWWLTGVELFYATNAGTDA